MLNDVLDTLREIVETGVSSVVDRDLAIQLLSGLAILFVGWLAARTASRMVHRFLAGRFSAQAAMVGRLSVFYGVVFLALAMAMRAFGWDISVLLGAAGVLTVALGFAAQTSASNIISGVFLLGEQPFVVGDIIKVGTTTGEVVSINLMSVQLRTFANLLVRVPNETLLKSDITNLTHFPIRRIDLLLNVPFAVDVERVKAVLVEVAAEEVLALDEPAPMVFFDEFVEQGVRLQFSVWAATDQYFKLRNLLPGRLLEAFREAGVEMALPHRVVRLEPPGTQPPTQASPGLTSGVDNS